MSARTHPTHADPVVSLPIFERLAPAPRGSVLSARIEAHTGPGDIVADLAGRGGWVARAAVDRQRRAISIESTPLTRMLADVVLRPPDVRHLDAAFQGMGASPRGESSLKVSIGDLFATRCATCGRMLVADEFRWAVDDDTPPRLVGRMYRCTVCRDQRGGTEVREADPDAEDVTRSLTEPGAAEAIAWAHDRFPPVDGAPDLINEMIDLHTPRQLVGLVAIMDRIEADLRAAPVLAALRLAMAHAILPASRLTPGAGRPGSLRVSGGHVRFLGGSPGSPGTEFRERNPWLAFEDGFRTVRGFVQRLEGGITGPVQARLGEDLRALGEGSATAVLAVSGPSAGRVLRDEATVAERAGRPRPRIRLVLGQPAVRPNLDRLAATYLLTGWTLGRGAAALLPVDVLASTSLRVPWSWGAAAIGRTLADVEAAMARDGRVVLLLEPGAEAMASAAIGAAIAGFRVAVARLAEPDDPSGTSVIELTPPGAGVPPGPRTRANVGLPGVPGGVGDPDLVPGPGLFAPPERFDRRPFSATDAARVVSDAAVETLRARGEPARFERLFGEILVALDRSGQLRRMVIGAGRQDGDEGGGDGATTGTAGGDPARTADTTEQQAVGGAAGGAATTTTAAIEIADGPDPVDRLLRLIRDELTRSTQQRVTEIEPGRWWLADRTDREAAAPPLADRVEWAVFSLLSTAGPLSENGFFDRIATMFSGHDLPDETLITACLDSYRGADSTSDRLVTGDDLLRRSQEHAAIVAALIDGGHRMGMRTWMAEREQARRDPTTGRPLGELLDDRERRAYLGTIGRAPDALAEVDVIWYIRGKIALLFEVEWTAILGETVLHRHVRIGNDDSLLRFLVVAPERTDLIRHKLERSPVLRAGLEDGGWHLIKWPHLQTFLAADVPDLDALEPLLGLDPVVERGGEQMPLF